MNPMDTRGGGGATFHALPSSQTLQSLLAADSSPSFHDPPMVDFSAIRPRRRRPEAESDDGEAEEEEEVELGRQPGKKRRLSATQVQHLEKSFGVENKLEPEKKNQLAKELNLQPRQVAIWFQNRRARFKTKQLERDYGVLKSSFDSLKSHYDDLLMEKDLLQNEVSLLRANLKMKETSNSDSLIQPEAPLVMKQEEASSGKSDVVDSESPNLTSPERSDFSQEDLIGSFMPVAADYGLEFGKAEEVDFHGGSCSGFGVPDLEGHPSYWSWLY